MTRDIYLQIFQDKNIEIDNNHYTFHKNFSFILNKGHDSITGIYDIIKRGDEFYLKTDPPIFNNKKELLISIILGDGDEGIRLFSE